VQKLRASERDALILVFSALLTQDVYKSLINAGCDGACEKGDASDIAVLHRHVQEYIDRQHAEDGLPVKLGLRGTIDAISGMLDRWNNNFPTQTKTAGA